MNQAIRGLHNLMVGATLSALVLTGGAVAVTATANAASTPMTATTWVNMRSGPSTSYGVVTVVAKDASVTATGSVTNGWIQVTYNGKTGWIYRTYLESATTTAPAPSTPTASGSVTTTTRVNVRTAPSLSSTVLTTLNAGVKLSTTGQKSGEWTQVIYNGVARWMYSAYLSTGTVSTAPTAGSIRTTANLYLRTAGNATASWTGVLPANSIVATTGRKTTDYTEIKHSSGLRWIATRYTAPATATSPAPAPAPAVQGYRWVNVSSMYIRATSASDGTIVTTVPRGTKLGITGVTSGDRTQVVWQGVARWAYTPFLSSTDPNAGSVSSNAYVTGYEPLNAYGKAVVQAVLANFPKIVRINGYRASSAYSSDHPSGRAVDIMIPNWSTSSGAAYGTEIAHYFQNNAGKYHVKYIIWRQQIWNAAYPTRGWRTMEDRGGATANHYDHVHVSVYDVASGG